MLFKEILNAQNAEIQKYIPVSKSLAFYKMKPSIEAAERDYLKPLVGKTTYEAIDAYYNNTGSGLPDETDIWDGLVERCQRAVINMAFLIGFDVINTFIDDSGFGRTESDKRKGLFHYQEDNMRQWFKTTGINSFDEILTYLNDNIDVFTDYAESSEYSRYKTSFFKTAMEFDAVYFISQSNLTFRRLKQYITLVEDFELKKLFGDTIWAEIKTEMAKSVPAAKVTALLPYIKNALAYLSVANLMEQTGADLTENGLYFTAWVAASNSHASVSPADKERVAALVTRNRGIGENYMAELRRYMNSNITAWPTFSGGSSYLFNRDNASKKTFWA